jgi:hypothetical protein
VLESTYGIAFELHELHNGYQFTLHAVKRASKKAEERARFNMKWFIHRALGLLADEGFKPIVTGVKLNAVVD